MRLCRCSSLFTAILCASGALSAGAQQGQQQIAELGRCTLESGQVIEHCRVGYRTFGRLNAAGDNAVLMPTYLYGTTGELSQLFGSSPTPQRLVDTTRFFGIALDAFGNGVSSSPSNSAPQHGTAFPAFSTRDMVEAEYRVATEVLHLKHAHAIVGLSMGGEQTFMWAVAHPEFFDLAVPIVATPRLTAYDLQSKQIMLESIEQDPGYEGGHYTKQPALRVANLYNVQAVTTPEYRNSHTSRADFAQFVASSEAPQRMDANDRVWQLRALMTHDAVRQSSIAAVARETPVHFLVIVSANDHMVVPAPALEWATAAHASTYVSPEPCAHLIMECDAAAVSARVQAFLAR